MHVQICTWNAGQVLHQQKTLDLSTWLSDDQLFDYAPPAMIAFGFQETSPLPLSLVGAASAQLLSLEDRLREELDNRASRANDTTYKLVRKAITGGIALFIYADSTTYSKIGDVQTSSVGCGPLYMSNKGAVGIRIQEKNSDISHTFVCAHLSAHDYNLARRNLDWQTIVSRMVFTANDGRQLQIYDTSHLYVFGDLNYRVSLESPRHISLSQFGDMLKQDHRDLLAHDQLAQEMKGGRALHGLSEGAVNFAPSYKFKVRTDTYKAYSKRIPSWCDRILYASIGDIQVRQYASVNAVRFSDHKPVIATYALRSEQEKTSPGTLQHRPPFSIDDWTTSKRYVGLLLDKVVGSVWCLVHFAGFGDDKLGLAFLLVSASALFLGKALGLDIHSALEYIGRWTETK